jgi:hypothetical protein
MTQVIDTQYALADGCATHSRCHDPACRPVKLRLLAESAA